MSDYLNSAFDAVLDAASTGVSSVNPRASQPEAVTGEVSKFQPAVDFDALLVGSGDKGGVSHAAVEGGDALRGSDVQGEGLGVKMGSSDLEDEDGVVGEV